MLPFAERLAAAVRGKNSLVCVGLDPRLDQLPAPLRPASEYDFAAAAEAYRLFCRGVIDAVADAAPLVKPQSAFFEQLGPAGVAALADVLAYARQRGLLTLLDAKRGDIGTTAEAYAAYLDPQGPWGADALTVNPYLGDDSLAPFVEAARSAGAGLFVLVKTSNPGGGMLQDLVSDGRTLYARVAELVERLAAETAEGGPYGAVGAVVGATYPRQLAELRQAMPHAWILVPGYGAQGGAAADVAGALDAEGLGAVVNSSRGIIFAHRLPGYRERCGDAAWQDAVRAAACDMRDALNAIRPQA